MRANKEHHGGLSVDGVDFKPESKGDIERRVKELRAAGHSVDKLDTDEMRAAKERHEAKKAKAMSTDINDIAQHLKDEGAI